MRADEQPDAAAIAEVEQQLAVQEAELHEMERANPRWRELLRPAAPVLALEELPPLLPSGALLIQCSFDQRDLILWAIDSGGAVSVHRTELDYGRLARSVTQFWTRCRTQHQGWAELAEELGALFLEPLGARLEHCPHVVFVPSGAAHRLPVHALTWGGRPLMDHCPVSVLPSASALAFFQEPAGAASGPVLAVGGPSEMSYRPIGAAEPQKENPLPWSAAEARFIASLFPGSAALTDDDASEANVRPRLDQFPYLHLATHGEILDTPLESVLLLANGDVLSLYELLGLDLGATELAVLSACETAGGEITTGDEVVGLTRGLLAAGVRDVVASLWKVNAHSTPLLMRSFYRMLKSGRPPALALNEARSHVRSLDEATARQEHEELRAAGDVPLPPIKRLDYAHPYHWAPFVHVGI
jgi:CHAT domain-containing protein